MDTGKKIPGAPDYSITPEGVVFAKNKKPVPQTVYEHGATVRIHYENSLQTKKVQNLLGLTYNLQPEDLQVIHKFLLNVKWIFLQWDVRADSVEVMVSYQGVGVQRRAYPVIDNIRDARLVFDPHGPFVIKWRPSKAELRR